jgi:ABC-type branched-subunit amino acid transport system ATPase component
MARCFWAATDFGGQRIVGHQAAEQQRSCIAAGRPLIFLNDCAVGALTALPRLGIGYAPQDELFSNFTVRENLLIAPGLTVPHSCPLGAPRH